MRRAALVLALLGAAATPAATAPAAAAPAAAAKPPALAPPPNIVRVVHRPAGAPPSIGPADALVTVEYFFVPGTVQARAPYRALVELQQRHPRRVRLVLRPLSHQAAISVPEALLEAHAQGKFFELFDAVTAAGRNLSKQDVLALAAQVGVDPARISAAWDDERHKDELDANDARRLRHDAIQVPDALFNGQRVERPLPSLSDTDLELEYDDAYARAKDLLDQGVPRAELAAAFDRTLERPPVLFVPGPTDDASDEPPPDAPPLAARPLELAGLPSTGAADAAVPVVVLCDLTQRGCLRQIATARLIAGRFPGDVRVVWSPWYAPDLADPADADAIARAALCAEEQGAGWDWIEKALERTQRSPRWGPIDAAIREVTSEAGADPRAVATCLAQRPLDLAARRIAAAVAAGIRHGPAVVVGGRIYTGGVAEDRVLQSLVEDELEPGLLGRAAPVYDTQ